MKEADSITAIKGIGPRKAEALGKLGLFSIGGLLYHFPRRYLDYSKITRVTEARHGDCAALELRLKSDPKLARVRRGLDITTARAFDQSGEITLTWYNQPYRMKAVVAGECVYACGRVDRRHGVKLINPTIYRELPGILPVYPLCAGLSQGLMRDAVRAALEGCEDIRESLPGGIRQKYGLIGLYAALCGIHFPKSQEDIRAARQRLAFEDTLLFSLTLSMLQYSLPKREQPLRLEGTIGSFVRLLPFEPTGAQLKAMEDIRRDLSGGRLMNRLLQGDVGSGKTAVALYAMYAAMQNGRQAALMAPTEILAAQHYGTLCGVFGAEKVAYLKGGMKKAEREAELARIESGEAKAITGTHALLQGDVEFRDLGMVITDEQHRFGVKQRAAIGAKGAADVLIMSATPIPRTLAMILYGDLSVSCIDELPPGRKPVMTRLVPEGRRQDMYKFIEKQAMAGQQAYIVCPLVEGSDALEDVQGAVELYEELKKRLSVPVGLLHGQMPASAKERAAAAFRRGETAVLVATTVIEVGVDVPNATIMAIENADRFGLAQLHQLRGRVGRGDKPSYCFLLSGDGGEAAGQRLSALIRTNSGFEIAETDLMLRGPGEFLGKRQHGISEFAAASLAMDIGVMQDARDAAEELLSDRRAMAEAAPLIRRAWSRLEAMEGEIARN